MDQRSWKKARRIVLAALEVPKAKRPALLTKECGNHEDLRATVESLLEAHQNAGEFPASPTAGSSQGVTEYAPSPPRELSRRASIPGPGTHVGRYRLVREIGAGGMGVVYLAQQVEPVDREVALKLIKLGMDTKEVVRRFEVERQALARMNHPNIARVFDAGVTEDGRPYFVMEYAPGLPMAEHCDRHRLSTKERLLLFMQVCHAVQHAHNRGVIHRDLKTNNILVTMQDAGPSPKVIDFGVAKATNQRLTEQTLYTEQGILIGTPEYMSPEQASGSGTEVDPRTDIYSLGVLLYELLVGQLPFDAKELRSKSYPEIQRMIREEQPATPSVRLLDQDPSSRRGVAQNRNTRMEILVRELRGDLDWITMKALEKDPDRRYESADGLAQDVGRYLSFEPIIARPMSLRYRLGKFMRRHRRVVVEGAVALLLLIAIFMIDRGRRAAVTEEKAVQTAVVEVQAEQQKEIDARRKVERALSRAKTDREEQEERAAADEQRVHAARRDAERAREQGKQWERLEQERREEILALSDLRRLKQLETDAQVLWPARPDIVPSMENWLQRAQDVVSRRDRHEQSLEELRNGTQARNVEERGGQIRQEWEFADPDARFRHDVLEELVESLVRFTDDSPRRGLIASVKERLPSAIEIEELTLESREAQAAWSEAIAHSEILLTPQRGLLPLRRDPQSKLWEFWHVASGERPHANADSDGSNPWVLTEDTGMILVLMPGGTFSGSSKPPVLGIYTDETDPEKLRVKHVIPGSIGDQKLRLRQNDIIVRVDGKRVRRNSDLEKYCRDGHRVKIEILTAGEHRLASVQLRKRRIDDRPIVLSPFFISKFEMTRGQWRRVMGEVEAVDSNREHDSDTGTNPVEHVTWWQCEQALRRLDLKLPTEAQWEYAARGGKDTAWWVGGQWQRVARHENVTETKGREAAATVGSFLPNPFGLHDVLGNVSEWCRDRTDAEARVYRGGAFDTPSVDARVTKRYAAQPTTASARIGLRPMRPFDE